MNTTTKLTSKMAGNAVSHFGINCVYCGKTTKAKRLPPGWHRNPSGDPVCGKCWGERYILRAIIIPVASPVTCDWPCLRTALKQCYQSVTRLSNWAVTELAKADVVRMPDMEKIPKPPSVYLYPGARKVCPDLPTTTTVSVLRSVEKRYRARRYDVIWLGKASLPSYRYPQPVPYHNQSWKAARDDDGRPLVSLRMGGERITLRLRGGHEFKRQSKGYGQIVDGLAMQGELALYEVSGQKSDHRNGGKGHTRLMCKMIAWVPKAKSKPRTGVLYLNTANDAMIMANNAKNQRLWALNGNHILRWAAQHEVQLQRWYEDSKLELRRKHVPFEARRHHACLKYNHRMNTAADEMAAQVVNYADRRSYAEIRWITGLPKMTLNFPWFRCESRIKQLCDERGINYVVEERIKDEN